MTQGADIHAWPTYDCHQITKDLEDTRNPVNAICQLRSNNIYANIVMATKRLESTDAFANLVRFSCFVAANRATTL